MTHSRRTLAALVALSVVLVVPAHAQEPAAEPNPQESSTYDWTEAKNLPGRGIPYGIGTLGPATVLIVATQRGAAVSRSADDGTWKTIRLPGSRPRSFAADVTGWQDGLMVVGGDQVGRGRRQRIDGLVWTSPDGANWSRTARIRNASPQQVLTTPESIFVVGAASKGARSVPTIWRSSDGIDWQASAIDEPVDGNFLGMDVARSEDGTWLACYFKADEGSSDVSHHLRRSVDDGATWGPGTGPAAPPRECGAVETMPGGFLMAITSAPGPDGSASTLWHSADGGAWRDVATIRGVLVPVGGDPALTALHHADAAGNLTLSIRSSFDGISWDEAGAPPLEAESIRVLDAATALDGRVVLLTMPSNAGSEGGFALFGEPRLWIGEPSAPG